MLASQGRSDPGAGGRGEGAFDPGFFHPNLPAVPSCLGAAGGRSSVCPLRSKESSLLPGSAEIAASPGWGRKPLGSVLAMMGVPGPLGWWGII